MATVAGLNQPKQIKQSSDGNNEQMWKTFKEEFKFYMLSAGFKNKGDDEKVALLINQGGEELRTIYNGLEWPAATNQIPDASVHYDSVVKAFDEHFQVSKNELTARKKFSVLSQKSGEALEVFINRIK